MKGTRCNAGTRGPRFRKRTVSLFVLSLYRLAKERVGQLHVEKIVGGFLTNVGGGMQEESIKSLEELERKMGE